MLNKAIVIENCICTINEIPSQYVHERIYCYIFRINEAEKMLVRSFRVTLLLYCTNIENCQFQETS